jgi:hypothetical protein
MSLLNRPPTDPGHPDENDEPTMKPDTPTEPDLTDYIDEAVARITDADIEERLNRTLHRAGYRHAGPCIPDARAYTSVNGAEERERADCPGPVDEEIKAVISEMLNQPNPLLADGTPSGDYLQLQVNLSDLREIGMVAPSVLHEWKLLHAARNEARAARLKAEQIIGAANDRSDQALSEAAKIVRDARDQAQRILDDAQREAERIRESAESQAEQTYRHHLRNLLLHRATGNDSAAEPGDGIPPAPDDQGSLQVELKKTTAASSGENPGRDHPSGLHRLVLLLLLEHFAEEAREGLVSSHSAFQKVANLTAGVRSVSVKFMPGLAVDLLPDLIHHDQIWQHNNAHLAVPSFGIAAIHAIDVNEMTGPHCRALFRHYLDSECGEGEAETLVSESLAQYWRS